MRGGFTLWMTLMVGLLAWGIGQADVVAEEPAENPSAEAATKPADDTAATRSRYDLPEGGVAELQKFIEELQSFRPTTAQQYQEHQQKSPAALKQAAEKIMALETDHSSDAYKAAQLVLLEARVANIGNENLDEKKNILRDLASALENKPASELSEDDLRLARTAVRALEYSGQSELAAEAYDNLAKVFARSDNERLSTYGAKFEGAARRLRLPGNKMEIKGTLLSGGEFDWNSYRGKVVLVDFWATWCGPCMAELPNVKKNYALYHDKGFDVVGISLDQNRQALESLFEKAPLPWVTLFDEDSPGWNHPVATYYGVSAIPTVLLVDKEGKVISLRARGEELGRLLEEQLGPVDDAKRAEVEAEFAEGGEKPARRAAPVARQIEKAPATALGDDAAIYLACGPVGGPGKVIQVDGQGRVLSSIYMPTTPYGIDVSGDELVLACPRGLVIKVGKDGAKTSILEGVLPAPIDIAAEQSSGNLVIADNDKDVLVRVPAGKSMEPETLCKAPGSAGHFQNMSVAVARDGAILFSTNQPEGVYRMSSKSDGSLGEQLIQEDSGVAADRSSDRWAAFSNSGLHVFEGNRRIADVPLPEGRRPYRGGIVAFGTDGKILVGLSASGGVELALVDLEEKKFQSLFAWDQSQDRVVDFAVADRRDWPDRGVARASYDAPARAEAETTAKARVADDSGDELAFVSFDPPLPHVFQPGERLTVKYRYKLNSADRCQIFVRPFTNGRRTPGYAAHGSPGYTRGSGEEIGWFELVQPGRIDEVRIQMVTGDKGPNAADKQLFIEANAEWAGKAKD